MEKHPPRDHIAKDCDDGSGSVFSRYNRILGRHAPSAWWVTLGVVVTGRRYRIARAQVLLELLKLFQSSRGQSNNCYNEQEGEDMSKALTRTSYSTRAGRGRCLWQRYVNVAVDGSVTTLQLILRPGYLVKWLTHTRLATRESGFRTPTPLRLATQIS